MFKINIKNLEVQAIIGILKFERKKAQKITVNAQIKYDSKKYLDYTLIVDKITKLLVKNRYFLVEDALIDITKKLQNSFEDIQQIKLSIDKNDT